MCGPSVYHYVVENRHQPANCPRPGQLRCHAFTSTFDRDYVLTPKTIQAFPSPGHLYFFLSVLPHRLCPINNFPFYGVNTSHPESVFHKFTALFVCHNLSTIFPRLACDFFYHGGTYTVLEKNDITPLRWCLNPYLLLLLRVSAYFNHFIKVFLDQDSDSPFTRIFRV